MPISKSHASKDSSERKPKAAISQRAQNQPRKANDYKRVDDIIGLVYVDICNGVSKSDIYEKVQKGLYEGMKKPLSRFSAASYYNAAMDRIGFDREEDEKKLRDMLYSRYESILQDAIKKGDMYNAREILDSIAKIFLPNRPDTAIQINSDKEGGVTVNFGFSNKDED